MIILVQRGESRQGFEYVMNIVNRQMLPAQAWSRVHGDISRVDKVALIKHFRAATQADLKTAKKAIEELLEDNTIVFKAHLEWQDLARMQDLFLPMGIQVAEAEVESCDPEEDRRTYLANLLASIPAQMQRQDSAAEQIHDLIAVARRLGMYDAADVLTDFQRLVEEAKLCGAPMG